MSVYCILANLFCHMYSHYVIWDTNYCLYMTSHLASTWRPVSLPTATLAFRLSLWYIQGYSWKHGWRFDCDFWPEVWWLVNALECFETILFWICNMESKILSSILRNKTKSKSKQKCCEIEWIESMIITFENTHHIRFD